VEEVRADRIVQLAEGYLDRSPEELLWLLESNWKSLHPRGLPQTRGRRSYWIRVRDDLMRRLKRHGEAVSVSTGLVTSDALVWAADNGYNGRRYELIIALVVALATKAALDAAPPHDDHDGPAPGGQNDDHRSP
jgi:hypothetical protein